MSRRILVPYDGAQQSASALEYALRTFQDDSITAMYVVDLLGDTRVDVDPLDPQRDELEAHGRELLSEATDAAEQMGIEIDTELRIGVPHRDLIEYATEADVDHVVVGGHGQSSVTHPFLGTVSETIVRRAPTSTTVVPVDHDAFDDVDVTEGTVLVPVDDSDQSTRALEYAAAQFPSASITALHVVRLPFEYSTEELEGSAFERLFAGLKERGQSVLDETLAEAAVDGSVDAELTFGKPSQSIVDYALDYQFDQVVMGIHGRSEPARFLTGSVAETVARRASFPVTLVRASADE